MISILSLKDGSERSLSDADLSKLTPRGIWIDVVDPSPGDISRLSELLGIPANHLELSGLKSYANIHFLEKACVLQLSGITGPKGPRQMSPIILAFSGNFLLSIRHGSLAPIQRARERFHKTKSGTPANLVYTIVDEVISDYFDYLEWFEEQTIDLEERIIEKPSQQLLREVLRLKAKIISFNKVLWYERGALFSLKKTSLSYVSRETAELFDDVHDDLVRQIDIVETFREILSDSLDAYLSTISNRINFSIRELTVVVLYLTIISTITVFPNTIATIFGIPSFGSSTNPWIIIGLLVVSTVLPAIWLLRRRWLSPSGLEEAAEEEARKKS